MADYWKSNKRKFCDFCKCWIADNKPSVEFHERGKRHNENVRIRLAEIGKKGKEDYENKLKEDDYMKSMEEAALQAYKKDIERNPDMMGNQIKDIASAKNASIVIGGQKEDSDNEGAPKVHKKWKEVVSPDGESYYWNMDTQETSWEVPEEGFIKKRKKKKKKGKVAEEEEETHLSYGPTPRVEAYSQWEAAKPTVEQVSLQLPELPTDDYYTPEVVYKKPQVTFKEKMISLGSSSGTEISFKKRKGAGDHKKNARVRTDDL